MKWYTSDKFKLLVLRRPLKIEINKTENNLLCTKQSKGQFASFSFSENAIFDSVRDLKEKEEKISCTT